MDDSGGGFVKEWWVGEWGWVETLLSFDAFAENCNKMFVARGLWLLLTVDEGRVFSLASPTRASPELLYKVSQRSTVLLLVERSAGTIPNGRLFKKKNERKKTLRFGRRADVDSVDVFFQSVLPCAGKNRKIPTNHEPAGGAGECFLRSVCVRM
jgi:hypothetical protein